MKLRSNRLTYAAMLVIAASGSSRSQAQPSASADKPTAAAYYPLAVGNTWQFEMTTAGTTRPVEFRVAKLETIDNVPMYRVDTVISGNFAASESLAANTKGLFRYRYNGIEIAPPILLLRNPVRIGDSWSTETQLGDQKLTVTCNVTEEKVSVEAGDFRAIKLVVETTVDGTQIKSEYWLAANTGIVKQLLTIGGKLVEIKLQKFSPAEPSPD
ncbi:MAG: hypothetical protein AB7I57_21895 [Pirellulales bacterium]